jgi:hypothetical protein
VIAPLILVIGFLSFGLFWIVYRYRFFYLSEGAIGTGGMTYPQSLLQLFTGLYVLELCLTGLLFLERNPSQGFACLPQAGIMILVTFLTLVFHWHLRLTFSPLFEPLHPGCGRDLSQTCASMKRPDETEDIMRHTALSCENSVVWIPQDTIGVSDFEIEVTRNDYGSIPISNAGAALDGRGYIHCKGEPPGS